MPNCRKKFDKLWHIIDSDISWVDDESLDGCENDGACSKTAGTDTHHETTMFREPLKWEDSKKWPEKVDTDNCKWAPKIWKWNKSEHYGGCQGEKQAVGAPDATANHNGVSKYHRSEARLQRYSCQQDSQPIILYKGLKN